MNSKIAVLSDPHFHNYKQHSHLVGGVNSRLLDVVGAVEEAFRIASDLGCKYMVIPGDLFHVRGMIKTGVLSHVLDLFDVQTNWYDMKVLMIPGNHDMEDFNGGPHALEPLNLIQNCSVGIGDGGVFADRFIVAIPYRPTTEKFNQEYDRLNAHKADIVMIHQGIDDARPSLNMPETGISASQFDRIVIAGHYHMPKLMGQVLSVGAPIQHNFGDEGQDRGFWILDGDKFEFHKLTYPEFLTIPIDKLTSVDISKKIVRVKTDDERRIEDVKAVLKEAYSWSVEVEKQYVSRHQETIKISSPIEMLSQYLKITGKYPNADELVAMGMEVLK